MGNFINEQENPILKYYDGYDEEGRLSSKYGQVEFLTTLRYIERYLTTDAKVIEVGAGTGRYSREIADMGYAVESVELAQSNIDIFNTLIKPTQNINISQGNALALSRFLDNSFDVTLLLGPMYHLYTEEDKLQAMSEAIRITKPNGIIFVAYCISDACILGSGFQSKKFDVIDYVKNGKINAETFETTSTEEDIFEMVRKEDIDELNGHFNIERMHYVATDLITNFMREQVNGLSDEEFLLYLNHHFLICERADMVGMTHHSLDVLRKI